MRYDRGGGQHPTSLFEAAAFQYSLEVRCPTCRHRVVFDAHALWWLFERKGWDARLSAVAKRLRCLPCSHHRQGASAARPIIALVRATPTSTSLPLPPARDWKRAVNRFR
ncbi:MAG: hypothetical protein B7Y45_06425 [Sphingomonas sp. 28-66-16]|nr:MAG: hypothetical protein B7Y45_06425 [Sphingomonas sp. 28-66-16]